MGLQLMVINLFVHDMGRSLEFYGRLGVEFPEGAEAAAAEHVEVTMESGLVLALDAIEFIRGYDAGFREPAGGSPNSIEFWLGSPAEVDARYAEMTGYGYDGHGPPFDASWGLRYALIDDPDGNTVALGASLRR